MIARLHDRDDFVRLTREGRRVRHELLWCSSLRDPSIVPPRVAFTLPRATGSAVHRNRARRRIRAILTSIEVPPGLWLIGISRPRSTSAVPASTISAPTARQLGRMPAAQLRSMVESLIAAARA